MPTTQGTAQDRLMALLAGLIAAWNESNPNDRMACAVRLNPIGTSVIFKAQ